MKRKTISNLPVRLNAAERPILLKISTDLGLIYKSRPSIAQILHYLAAGEALIMLHAFDTSAEMRFAAARLRELLERMDVADYSVLEQPLSGLASALESAAAIRAEFEKAERDEVKEDYSHS